MRAPRSLLVVAAALLLACGTATRVEIGDGGRPEDAPEALDATDASECPIATGTRVLAGGSARLRARAGAACDGTRALVVALPSDASSLRGWAELVTTDDVVLVEIVPSPSDASPWRAPDGTPSAADRALVVDVVDTLTSAHAIDPARVFVWADGAATALATGWLAPASELSLAGVALTDLDPATPHALAGSLVPRLFLSTGARAPGIDAQLALRAAADAAGIDTVVRARDQGTGSPAWLAREAWPWLDRGLRVENGPRSTTWTPVRFPWDATLFALTAMPDGTLRAASLEGEVFGTNDSGKWDRLATLDRGALVDAIDGPPDALVVAATRGLVVASAGGFSEEDGPGGAVRALARDGETLFAITSSGLFERASASAPWVVIATPRADLDALAISPVTHTLLAVGAGAGYVRRTVDGAIEARASGSDALRFDAVAASADGALWIVGAGGAVLRSEDDGRTFVALVGSADDPIEEDLTTAGTGPDGAFVAGGAHGLVVTSHDGTTLTSHRIGWLGPIGAAVWLNSGEIFVTSDHGVVLVAEGL